MRQDAAWYLIVLRTLCLQAFISIYGNKKALVAMFHFK